MGLCHSIKLPSSKMSRDNHTTDLDWAVHRVFWTFCRVCGSPEFHKPSWYNSLVGRSCFPSKPGTAFQPPPQILSQNLRIHFPEVQLHYFCQTPFYLSRTLAPDIHRKSNSLKTHFLSTLENCRSIFGRLGSKIPYAGSCLRSLKEILAAIIMIFWISFERFLVLSVFHVSRIIQRG